MKDNPKEDLTLVTKQGGRERMSESLAIKPRVLDCMYTKAFNPDYSSQH